MELAAWGIVIGRVLLGGFFLAAGIEHAFVFDKVAQMMAARGIPQPRAVLAVASVFQVVAGAGLMAGLFVAPAALGLVAFTIAASVMLLDFWNSAGPERQGKIQQVKSNVAIVGGLLIAAATA